MSDNSEVSFSNYGIYDLESDLELLLPNTNIKFHKISDNAFSYFRNCLLYTSPSPRDLSTSRMPSSA